MQIIYVVWFPMIVCFLTGVSCLCVLSRLLHTERGEVPDVPAIYFCQPTEENLIRIGQDFNDGLYSSYYLNFISPISRQKMEDLALSALQAGCQTNIKKVK